VDEEHEGGFAELLGDGEAEAGLEVMLGEGFFAVNLVAAAGAAEDPTRGDLRHDADAGPIAL